MPAARRPRRLTGAAPGGSPALGLRDGALAAPGVEVVVLLVAPGTASTLRSDVIDGSPDAAIDWAALAERHGFQGDAGEVLAVPLAAGSVRSVLLAGCGDGSPRAWRRSGAAIVRRVKDNRVVAIALGTDVTDGALAALAEALLLGSYRYRAAGAERKGSRIERIDLVGNGAAARQPVLDAAVVRATATLRARTLANTPSLTKTPQWLADEAVTIAESAGLDVQVRDERELAAAGFGGILGVGLGSSRPPRLIELRYAPRGARRHVVLVGKGITFDSGGLSLKTNDGMVSMKTDMAGGGAVLAAMGALRALDVRVTVTGLVPAAENMPSGTAQRPGDVIRHYGGRTSEVLNTDAEGRLVLADALAYAVDQLRPDVLVDLATLTGAASLGLGRRHAALYATTDELATELAAAAEETGERVWRMPLVEDYRFAIDSRIADVANVGTAKTISAGSITAALFLREFTGGRPWAHLDIAGPARADGDEDEVTKGATGFGARLLLRWLERQA